MISEGAGKFGFAKVGTFRAHLADMLLGQCLCRELRTIQPQTQAQSTPRKIAHQATNPPKERVGSDTVFVPSDLHQNPI
jgi:hypothetical protein